MNKYIVGLAILFGIGCADGTTNEKEFYCQIPDTVISDSQFVVGEPHYNVIIDRAFSNNERSIILTAMAEWQRSVKGVIKYTVSYKSFKQSDNVLFGTNVIKVFKAGHEHTWLGLTSWEVEYSRANINIVDSMGDDDMLFMNVALHEFGHAFGLEHDDKYKSVMYEYSDGTRTQVYCADIKSFCDIYRCSSDCVLELRDYD